MSGPMFAWIDARPNIWARDAKSQHRGVRRVGTRRTCGSTCPMGSEHGRLCLFCLRASSSNRLAFPRFIGGGRKFWDGSGGSNGALDHFTEEAQQGVGFMNIKTLWKSDAHCEHPASPASYIIESRADLHIANALCKEAAKLAGFLTPAASEPGAREGQLLPPCRDLARAGRVRLKARMEGKAPTAAMRGCEAGNDHAGRLA